MKYEPLEKKGWLHYNNARISTIASSAASSTQDTHSPVYKLHAALPLSHFDSYYELIKTILIKALENEVIPSFKIINLGESARVNNPFTIYFFQDDNRQAVIALCRELEGVMADVPPASGEHLSIADLPLTPHLTFRQKNLNHQHASPEELQRLREQGLQSQIYQDLQRALEAPNNNDNDPDRELKEKEGSFMATKLAMNWESTGATDGVEAFQSREAEIQEWGATCLQESITTILDDYQALLRGQTQLSESDLQAKINLFDLKIQTDSLAQAHFDDLKQTFFNLMDRLRQGDNHHTLKQEFIDLKEKVNYLSTIARWKDYHWEYFSAVTRDNKGILKEINYVFCTLLGIKDHMDSYVGRHDWYSIAGTPYGVSVQNSMIINLERIYFVYDCLGKLPVFYQKLAEYTGSQDAIVPSQTGFDGDRLIKYILPVVDKEFNQHVSAPVTSSRITWGSNVAEPSNPRSNTLSITHLTKESEQPGSSTERTSCLNPDEVMRIMTMIQTLRIERESFGFFKQRKQNKINGLDDILDKSTQMPIAEAIRTVRQTNTDLTKGIFSTRTADLLHDLEARPDQSNRKR